jgi:hypothetical protein
MRRGRCRVARPGAGLGVWRGLGARRAVARSRPGDLHAAFLRTRQSTGRGVDMWALVERPGRVCLIEIGRKVNFWLKKANF